MKTGTKLLGSLLALSLLSGCGVLGGGDGDAKKNTPTIGKRTPILSGESGATIDPELAAISVILPAATANSDWAQSGGNASKSVGHVALGSSLAQVWTANINGTNKRERLASSPVVSGGRLFVIDTRAIVYAFDAATGAEVWSSQIEVEGNAPSRFGGGVSVLDSMVFATNGVGDVVALNAADGSQVWKVRPAGPLRGSPTLSNGNVYVMTQDNQIYALSMTDGSVQWNEAGTVGLAGIFGVAAPSAGQGTVLAGYSSGELTAYRYENGRNLWDDALARTSISTSVSTLSDIDADPVIDRGRVFALGQGGRMAAYELVTGQRIWELNIAGITTPVVSGEWVFVLTDDAKLLCIARPNGKVRWISQLSAFKNDEKKKNPINWTGPVLAGTD